MVSRVDCSLWTCATQRTILSDTARRKVREWRRFDAARLTDRRFNRSTNSRYVRLISQLSFQLQRTKGNRTFAKSICTLILVTFPHLFCVPSIFSVCPTCLLCDLLYIFFFLEVTLEYTLVIESLLQMIDSSSVVSPD